MHIDTEPRIPAAVPVIGNRVTRVLRSAARGAGAGLVVVVALVAAVGWLYVLRGTRSFVAGPNVNDSLPLLQLAGFDAQPLLRVAVAFLPAGIVAGVALRRFGRISRAMIAAVLGAALLLFASQVSFALARNLRLGDVVWSRGPGLGPGLEAALFGIGCLLPAQLRGAGAQASGRHRVRDLPRFVIAGVGDLRLSHREHGDASEHEPDGQHVP